MNFYVRLIRHVLRLHVKRKKLPFELVNMAESDENEPETRPLMDRRRRLVSGTYLARGQRKTR